MARTSEGTSEASESTHVLTPGADVDALVPGFAISRLLVNAAYAIVLIGRSTIRSAGMRINLSNSVTRCKDFYLPLTRLAWGAGFAWKNLITTS